MADSKHIGPMTRALELARRGWGDTHPNPMVGAVVVEHGEIVAEGWHQTAGQDHAEIAAIKALGREPGEDATLYVTLEPCSTSGRTGACTDAIIKHGFKHVVIGAIDPNPNHAGHGIKVLEAAGIEVTTGVLEEACSDLNLIFNHWIVKRTPFIAGKIATTIDGKVATRTGHSKWITGETARADVHRWRRLFPAIACGNATALADDPAMTARIKGEDIWCPRRFIFDRGLDTLRNPKLQVFTDAFREKTTLVTSIEQSNAALERAESLGIEIWALPTDTRAWFFDAFLKRCASIGITGVYVEGGANILSSMLDNQILDYLFAYRAPKLLADIKAPPCFIGQNIETMNSAFSLKNVKHATLEDDQLMRGFISK
ncbi:bifunctional diaminohydroxyphosphoribosylaminopyrimidine deaminase/5-amino-6-(5-phosphoribosylamino)uracil reductase RibD [Rubellicoccus peritrichatus]|uniref:Riboflavin biosynthesis protein RibD n=1 Tax=Rubellicoccus peritrichatus TaxID=3080537 RepID=A0AAQ3L9U2_9BACT|nr:bifunctional diaminohydroxyphosphoribosylaminopyrimidine deaminase/5-amino-6-(5-phosphoribosylamino)uracil reductase RibD [Puniceicoccus sp. CR14]WOO41751.1 bifunctional diaminohydroxyphosphoribosylaminopyrimidine deaminase/5-amino-6-(5-phosphoribosylamino)uracil reductase RibD [Puniceicoccus sp. CR14]